MTLFLQILRVVCGLGAILIGGYIAGACALDALRWRKHHLNRDGRTLSREDVSVLLGGAVVLGSGIFNLWAVWS